MALTDDELTKVAELAAEKAGAALEEKGIVTPETLKTAIGEAITETIGERLDSIESRLSELYDAPSDSNAPIVAQARKMALQAPVDARIAQLEARREQVRGRLGHSDPTVNAEARRELGRINQELAAAGSAV